MRVSRKFVIAAFSVAGLLLAAIIGIPNWIHPRTTSASAPCVNFLRQLDGAKQEWALEYGKTTNDVPTWDDLRPYIKWESDQVPRCGRDGVYRLGRVGVPPTCSIGGPSHTLPE